MAINTRLIGNIGFIRGYADGDAKPNVIYLLPPAPYGWTTRAVGSGVVKIEFIHPDTKQVISSFSGTRAATGHRTSASPAAQEAATTVGIGVRFAGIPSLTSVAMAPIGADGDAYALPPTI